MPKPDNLHSRFKPSKYKLGLQNNAVQLLIEGQKIGPPSHRISLHQSGLEIINAKITRFDKRGPAEIEVLRINHLPTVQQVRLHSGSVMYPGRYQVELEYNIESEKLSSLGKTKLSRELLPSIDEPEAWQAAEVEFKL